MTYIFRTYSEAAADVREWSRRLPDDIVATCGVPRSGTIVALQLAQHRNIHCVGLRDLQEGRAIWRHALRRRVPSKRRGRVLVIDDTSWSGRTITEIRRTLPDQVAGCGIEYAALYAGDGGIGHLDHYGRRLPFFSHSFEWNIGHDVLSRKTIFDLDGTLCEDYTLPGEEGEHAEAYQRHMAEAKCILRPSYPVLAICTARLEKNRKPTEDWLRRQGIEYQVLDMCPASDQAERHAMKGFAHRKAAYYRKRNAAILFVENRADQARQIYTMAKKPVLDIERMVLHGGGHPDPFN